MPHRHSLQYHATFCGVVTILAFPMLMQYQPRNAKSAHVYGIGIERNRQSGSGSRVVSPAVVATWFSHYDDSRIAQLDLMVLWCGTPGWFLSEGSQQGGGGRGSKFGEMISTHYIERGGVRLVVEFDSGASIATITGRSVSTDVPMQDVNVILVDEVDSDSGLVVLGTRWVEPELSGSTIEPIFQRSPELFDYLMCDARLPEPHQAMMELVCSRMRGQ